MHFKPRKQHVYNYANLVGRDFIVGDLHGEVQQLYKQLTELDFDYKRDRLFCTGDLLSRGVDSIACLNLLTEKWFYSVMGNHEQLFLLGFSFPYYWEVLKGNNGQWLIENQHDFNLLVRWKTLIEICMPLTRTIEINTKKVGVSHASAINNWSKLQRSNLSDDEIWQTLWSRPLKNNECLAIESIDYVVHGHSAVPVLTNINNRYWIDTFSSTSAFTILNLATLK